MARVKFEYNSPVTLSYALVCAAVLLLSQIFGQGLMRMFTVYQFSFSSATNYFQLFSHVIGHAGWDHLLSNFGFILILGPILEERYGSKKLLIMILLTALITGILNITFYSTGLLGASGIVFMMIILSGFMSFKSGKIPITLVLVVLLFLGKEITNMFKPDQISQFAHIIGGICGGAFGFFLKEENKESFSASSPTDRSSGFDY